jgi:hypothetical protein
MLEEKQRALAPAQFYLWCCVVLIAGFTWRQL